MFQPQVTRKRIGMRMLLIEDDSATAQSIELMLKFESFKVSGLGYRADDYMTKPTRTS
jgi:DNA-binding response OmpR family regulator